MKICYEISIDCGELDISDIALSGLDPEAASDLILDLILSEITGDISWWIE